MHALRQVVMFIDYEDHITVIEYSCDLDRLFTCKNIQAKNYIHILKIEAMREASMNRMGRVRQ